MHMNTFQNFQGLIPLVNCTTCRQQVRVFRIGSTRQFPDLVLCPTMGVILQATPAMRLISIACHHVTYISYQTIVADVRSSVAP